MGMQIGPYEVSTIVAGRFKLDGGAMFGNVPKPLWSREQPADDKNRIDMAARVLVLKGDGRVILVDTGCGHKMRDKDAEIFALDYAGGTLISGLASVGVGLDEVTDVIYTHLHFDHSGGSTTVDGNGEPVPTFPNATYHVQKANLATAREPNLRERASYLPENWEPAAKTGQLREHDGAGEILPGVHTYISHGHTAGLQGLKIQGEGDQPNLYYPADLMPTNSHLKLPYTMGYDVHAVWILDEKKKLLDEVRRERDIIVFEHAASVAAATIRDGKKYQEIAEELTL